MLTENALKSQLVCGKLPTSGQIETLSLSFSPSRSSLVAQTHFKRATIQLTGDTLRGSSPATPIKRATIQLTGDTLRGSSPATPRDGTPAVLDTKGYTMPSSDRPSCAILARQPHPQSPKKDLLFRCHGVLATPPRPTHKAGDPGTGKPRRSFRSLLFQESILGLVRTVPDLPASTRNHRDLAAWPPSRQGQN